MFTRRGRISFDAVRTYQTCNPYINRHSNSHVSITVDRANTAEHFRAANHNSTDNRIRVDDVNMSIVTTQYHSTTVVICTMVAPWFK